jgi:hypothetical protein
VEHGSQLKKFQPDGFEIGFTDSAECAVRLRKKYIQVCRLRFPALPDFLSSSGSGTGSTQPREPREVN